MFLPLLQNLSAPEIRVHWLEVEPASAQIRLHWLEVETGTGAEIRLHWLEFSEPPANEVQAAIPASRTERIGAGTFRPRQVNASRPAQLSSARRNAQ